MLIPVLKELSINLKATQIPVLCLDLWWWGETFNFIKIMYFAIKNP